jgi:hypothetical protein
MNIISLIKDTIITVTRKTAAVAAVLVATVAGLAIIPVTAVVITMVVITGLITRNTMHGIHWFQSNTDATNGYYHTTSN